MSVVVQEFRPSPALAPFVLWYWEGVFNTEAAHQLSQRVIPSGYVELIIHLSAHHCHLPCPLGWTSSPDYTIIGLHSQPYEVHFPQQVNAFGIRFKPEGIQQVFGVPAAEFRSSYEDMALVLDQPFRQFCQHLQTATATSTRVRLTNSYLSRLAERNKATITYVSHAAELIRSTKGDIRINAIAHASNISLRQLERGFKAQLGVTPKHYLRLSRMNEVQRLLAEHGQLSFTELAYRTGYADQAHFIRDFRRLTGENPTIFVRESTQYLVNPTLEGQPLNSSG